MDFYKAVSPRYKKIFVVFGNQDLTIGNQSYFRNNPFTTFFYFNGQKYLAYLKNQSIWFAGHTHSARAKDLVQGDGRRIHLKLNPVGYPDKIQEMQKEWMSF